MKSNVSRKQRECERGILNSNMGRYVLFICVVSVAIFISTNARPLTEFEEQEIINAVRNVLKAEMANTLDQLEDTNREWDIGNSLFSNSWNKRAGSSGCSNASMCGRNFYWDSGNCRCRPRARP
ncbi:uncharacterized protein [Amphiura filiformis]|uniref:uncharacterized protein n=1 Tax=Amphiura filiformis TaxID=82378 RepID=UPI003B213D31